MTRRHCHHRQLCFRLLKPKPTDNPVRIAKMANANSDALRSHFRQLTAALLEPFESYFIPTPPPPGRLSVVSDT